MRLSCLVVATILLLSVTLPAQHSSGGGFSSGGSHGGFSGGSNSSSSSSAMSSSGSHYSGSSASRVGTAGAPAARASTSHSSPSVKSASVSEKKSSRSFFHPFRKTKPVQTAAFKPPAPCLKGPCKVCPPGESRSGIGLCTATNTACSFTQSWVGSACGAQYLFADCRDLAEQLASQRAQMRGRGDYGQSLRLRMLEQQYQQCMMRSHTPFGAYAFNSALLLDTP